MGLYTGQDLGTKQKRPCQLSFPRISQKIWKLNDHDSDDDGDDDDVDDDDDDDDDGLRCSV